MRHKGLREPHLLLASPNPMRLLKNLPQILAPGQLNLINSAISDESALLHGLARAHLSFAVGIPIGEWRQRTSRLYYAAYNCRRAVMLRYDGSFSTDSTDHQNVEKIPDIIEDHATYSKRLKDLREDRNLADYSHLARVQDLLIPISESADLVEMFFGAAEKYLRDQGVLT